MNIALTETSTTTQYVTNIYADTTDYLPSSFLTSSWLMKRFRWPLTPRRDHRVVNSKADHSTRDHNRPILTVLCHLLHHVRVMFPYLHPLQSRLYFVSSMTIAISSRYWRGRVWYRTVTFSSSRSFSYQRIFLKFNTIYLFVMFSIYPFQDETQTALFKDPVRTAL